MDCSPPGSSVHGMSQTRILEWVAISFSRECSQPRDRSGSHALQADSLPSEPPGKPQNTGVGILSLSPGDLPNPGIEPWSPELQVYSLPAEPQRETKNTGVGSLSLSPGYLPNPELNWGLLHWQVSHQGSPACQLRRRKLDP